MSNMADVNVLSEVLGLIESTMKVPADQVDIDANMESFGVNSLIVMELMENIEKAFDVTLTPAQFSNIDTVRGLTGLVERLLAEKAGPAPVAPSAQPAQQTALREAPLPVGPSHQVLDFVSRQYGIDLSSRSFGSVEEIADLLVASRGAELMRHYGLSDGGAPTRQNLIAIVGMSCRLPDAEDPRAFWENLLARRNSMREIPKSRWDWEAHYAETITQGKTVSKWGALIEDVDCFDAGFFGIPAEEAAAIDPQLRLMLEETYHAVEDAGIDMKRLAGSRTGVFVGYEFGEYEQHLRKLNNQDFTKGPLFSSSSPSYYLSNRISHSFDLCGPSESFNVNCASSAVAINRAYYSLINGESELAIAGAASLNLFEGDYIAASQYGVLSPDGSSGVFDDAANGFTRGEGVAAVVLKRLADAERDGDRIYGLIRSTHENYRGAARNISEVKHEAITQVLSDCYEKASVPLESIDYVEVDGYASKWADSFEYEGVKGAFAKSAAGRKHVALGSVKGNIGNLEPVSGVTNLIKLALSLHHKKFPATISMKKVNSFLDVDKATHPLYIATEEIPFEGIRGDAQRPIRAGVNSFADSGTNVHILLEEYLDARAPAKEARADKHLFVLSAKSAERLGRYVQKYLAFLSGEEHAAAFADLAYTAQVGREAHGHRLAIVAASQTELLDKLKLVDKAGIKDKLGLDGKEIFYGRLDPAEKNPLTALITPEMARMQLTQSMSSGQWKQVALLWVAGVAIPWETIWQGRAVRRVALPTYPFARERHWIDVDIQDGPRYTAVAAKPATAPEPVARNVEAAPPAWHFFLPSAAARPREDGAALSSYEKMELFLRQEIAAQQDKMIDEIALDKDFIELGMNSIGVAELIIKTDRLLRTNLSPSVLFKHPEVASLAEYLAANYAERVERLVATREVPAADEIDGEVGADVAAEVRPEPLPADILIPMQVKGDQVPIFAVPGAGGNALSMQQLSHALGGKQPFYCLEPVGLDGVTPPMASVEDIAEFNLRALREVQAKGPYRLLGYSNGGIVAYEMARQLSAQGEKVASLILLDSLAPALLDKDLIEEMTVAVFNHFIASLGATSDLDATFLQQVPLEQRSEYLYDYVEGLGLELPRQQFLATFAVATASELACRAYQPAGSEHAPRLTLFRAGDSFKDVPADYGWGPLCSGEVDIRDVDATHFTIVEKSAVAEIARAIVQELAQELAQEMAHESARIAGKPSKSAKDRAGKGRANAVA